MSKVNFQSVLAENLMSLLAARGIRKFNLAQATGIGGPTLDAILSGEGNPRLDTLIKISEFFGVSVNELLNPEMPAREVQKKSNLELIQSQSASELINALTNRLGDLEKRLDGIPMVFLDAVVGLPTEVYSRLLVVVQAFRSDTQKTDAKKKKSAR
jgi:transcriptional regulator with XRE-family HTH domain